MKDFAEALHTAGVGVFKMAGFVLLELQQFRGRLHEKTWRTEHRGPWLPRLRHGPWPVYDNFRDGYITLFNPSAMKGIGVFIDLAHQLPGRRFAAVPTWATTQTDLDALTDIPNVDLLPPSRNVDDLLAKTSVLLMPSLIESMSVLTIEALLREAKLGVDYLIEPDGNPEFRRANHRLEVIAPPQNIDPWVNVIEPLFTDEQLYKDVSHRSWQKAVAYSSKDFAGAWLSRL